MTDTDARVAREIAIDELKTTNKYEALADAADDPKVKDVVRDIAREEKVHTGEAAAILDEKDEEATPAMKEGLDEAREMLKSTPSFAELFVNERSKVLEKTGMLTDEGLNEFKEKTLAKAGIDYVNQKFVMPDGELAMGTVEYIPGSDRERTIGSTLYFPDDRIIDAQQRKINMNSEPTWRNNDRETVHNKRLKEYNRKVEAKANRHKADEENAETERQYNAGELETKPIPSGPSLRAQTKAMEQQIAAEESADRPHRGKLALPASWDMSSDHENKGDQNRKGYHNTADNKAPRPADIQEPLTEGLEASSQGLGRKERDALVDNRMKNNALAAEEANERFKQAFMSLRR